MKFYSDFGFFMLFRFGIDLRIFLSFWLWFFFLLFLKIQNNFKLFALTTSERSYDMSSVPAVFHRFRWKFTRYGRIVQSWYGSGLVILIFGVKTYFCDETLFDQIHFPSSDKSCNLLQKTYDKKCSEKGKNRKYDNMKYHQTIATKIKIILKDYSVRGNLDRFSPWIP